MSSKGRLWTHIVTDAESAQATNRTEGNPSPCRQLIACFFLVILPRLDQYPVWRLDDSLPRWSGMWRDSDRLDMFGWTCAVRGRIDHVER